MRTNGVEQLWVRRKGVETMSGFRAKRAKVARVIQKTMKLLWLSETVAEGMRAAMGWALDQSPTDFLRLLCSFFVCGEGHVGG